MKQKNLKRYIRHYMQNAPLFMSLIRPIEASLFIQCERFIKAPVVDFGCGDGFFCETVWGKGKIDIGIDLSTNPRVEIARKNKTYKKLILYDGGRIPLPSGSCPTVVSNCVMEHIPDISMSLRQLRRILKPGGFLITSVMTSRWSDFLMGTKLFGRRYATYLNRMQDHASLYSENQWDDVFAKSGFEIVEKKGYLHRKNAQILDVFHYLSLPSLVSYSLTRRWVLFPQIFDLLKADRYMQSVIESERAVASSKTRRLSDTYAALFYVLQKKK